MSLNLEHATKAVDDAWQRWKTNKTVENEIAYDRAYEEWKSLGGERGVGRPRSGEPSTLTSSDRAREARARQQQAASRWEKVAPFIQRLRRAVTDRNTREISQIAAQLVKETEMLLSNLQVVHAQPDSDFVVLNGWHAKQMVLAFIPTIHLDDHFRCRHLNGKQANLLVDRNLDAFARIISAKYERGEYRPYSRFGSTLPRVDITLDDLENSEETFTTEVLKLTPMWVAPDGRTSPA